MTQAGQLSIRLLGAPEAQIGGAPLPLHRQKARALLFYLAATGRAHTRDQLARLLWGDSAEREARHSLRSCLYHIRQVLRASGIASIEDGDLLRLPLAGDACDVACFQRLLEAADERSLSAAVALYRGPLLEGFTLADAPTFEKWARELEAELAQLYLDALGRLAAAAEARADWDAAIGYAQRIVQADPLDELAQRRLIELYRQRGAVGQALRQYHQLETDLRQELGLAPSDETRRLFQQAFQQRQGQAPERPLAPPGLPFVGRDALVEQLLSIARAAAGGRGTTILIEGEAGIGKTRLLAELASRLPAQTAHWTVLQGSCSPFDDLLAYGPFFEAFRAAELGDLADLPIEPSLTPLEARSQFQHRVLHALRSLARRAPVLLAIEDLQLASGATLNLFGFLSARLRDLPIVLIGTAQRAESIPALRRLIALGRRRADLQLLPLAPLAAGSVAALLRAMCVSHDTVATLDEWLTDRSAGNPFVLAEVLAQLRAENILRQAGGGWQIDTLRWPGWSAAFSLPETTHDLVAWRLDGLTPAQRQLLDTLAVAGEPLPLPVLRALSGLGAGELAAMLDDLLARQLLIGAASRSIGLPHHLLRDTLLHRLSGVRRRLIHRTLAAALEAAAPEISGMAMRIAHHALAGEDILRARRYGLQIVSELPRQHTAVEIADFLQQLYELVAPDASPSERRLLAQSLGRAHQSLGHLATAAEWHLRSLRIAQDSGDQSSVAAARFELGALALVSNDYRAAAAAAEAGLAALAAIAPAQAPTAQEQAGALIASGHRLLGAALAMEGSDLPAAEQHLRAASAAHRRATQPGELCATLFELGNVAAQRGQLARALEHYQEAARVAADAGEPYFLTLAHNNIAYHNLRLGRLAAARHALRQGRRLAEREALAGALQHLHSTAGEIELYLGDWRAAAQAFAHTRALASDLGSLERQAGAAAGLGLAARGQGDTARAVALLQEALALIADHGYWHLRTRIQIWLAETLPPNTAWAHLEPARATARAQGRALLLLRAERLRASLIATTDYASAHTCFAAQLARAEELALPLDRARVQAAWGSAALRHAPAEARALLAAARASFAAHDARAELAALDNTARRQ